MTMDAVLATIVLGGQTIILKYKRSKKILNFYVNIMNLSKPLGGGLATNMHKASRPSGSLDSLNPRRWKARQLHHHGGGVC